MKKEIPTGFYGPGIKKACDEAHVEILRYDLDRDVYEIGIVVTGNVLRESPAMVLERIKRMGP